jgi:GMP synthase (glutamine-hydrolysing)
MMQKTAVAIRHVAFEDLGSFEKPLRDAGFELDYRDAGAGDLLRDGTLPDLLIVLGGPIGAYEEAAYPFILDELSLLSRQMDHGRPTLGICLGAQLMARALGARVYPGKEKEIGWKPITLTSAGARGPLRHLDGIPVLHWHGDTFDLPAGCELLASTSVCRQQAFAKGPNILGLQFHAEVVANRIEHWLIGHACEIGQQKIAPQALRAASVKHAALEARAETIIREWLAALDIG